MEGFDLFYQRNKKLILSVCIALAISSVVVTGFFLRSENASEKRENAAETAPLTTAGEDQPAAQPDEGQPSAPTSTPASRPVVTPAKPFKPAATPKPVPGPLALPSKPTDEGDPLTPLNPALTDYHPKSVLFVHGQESAPRVALTFDAGSNANAVNEVLKVLQEHHVHATFFLTGRFCEKFPEECRAIADAGMELGNHSYDHPHFTHLSDAMIDEELEKAEAAIVKVCGRGAKPLFRFPYGDSNPRTQRAVAAAGYQSIHWTLDSLDAFGKPKTAAFVVDRINSRIKPGFITLMHVSCTTSAQALPRIFEKLDQMGATVVPVSELLLNKPEPARPASHPSNPSDPAKLEQDPPKPDDSAPASEPTNQ